MTEQAQPAPITTHDAQRAILEALQLSSFAPESVLESAGHRMRRAAAGETFDSGQYYELQHPQHPRLTVTLEVTVDFFSAAVKESRIDEHGDRVSTVHPEVKVNWGGHGAVAHTLARAYAEVLTAAGDIAAKIDASLKPGVTYVSATAQQLEDWAAQTKRRELEQAIIHAWAGDAYLRHALYDTRKGAMKHAPTPDIIREKLERGDGGGGEQHITYNLMIPGKKTKVYKLTCDMHHTYATRIG
jgi:hypothetical protein